MAVAKIACHHRRLSQDQLLIATLVANETLELYLKLSRMGGHSRPPNALHPEKMIHAGVTVCRRLAPPSCDAVRQAPGLA